MVEYFKRPGILDGRTYRKTCGCGKMYVTVNYDNNGLIRETFFHLGKAGQCGASQLEALGRAISTALRSGADPILLAKQLIGIRCPSSIWDNGDQILSCADAIGKAIKEECERQENLKAIEEVVERHVQNMSVQVEPDIDKVIEKEG